MDTSKMTEPQLQRLQGSAAALLTALERLSWAALKRDSVMGCPIALSDARAELNAARIAADEVIAKVRREG